MNPNFKKILYIAGFVVASLVIPTIVLLIFFDATTQFSIYVVVYSIIIFGIFGYLVLSVKGMEKNLEETMEEIKMQNAAIAHKLVGSDAQKIVSSVVPQQSVNVPLNPEEPLVVTKKVSKQPKQTDDGFDDFK